ncbi:hypothetical protein HRbin08_00948 [bacterium HR08]|nr:hypothetical protein HRbin08_00948 [bacterium HR08]
MGSFAQEWLALVTRVKAANDRLMAELEGCWRDCAELLERQLRESERLASAIGEFGDLQAWRNARREAARTLLHEPHSRWEQARFLSRVVMAIELYERALDDAVAAMPEVIFATAAEAMAALDVGKPRRWRRWIAFLRRARRPWPVRVIIATEFQRQRLRRLNLEGRFALMLAEVVRSWKGPWDAIRATMDAVVAGRPAGDLGARLQHLRSYRRDLVERGRMLLSAWREQNERSLSHLAQRLANEAMWRRRPKQCDVSERVASSRTYWVSQMRAAEMELRLERQWEEAEDRAVQLFQKALASFALEHESLLAELEEARNWLAQRIAEGAPGDFPPLRAEITPAAYRLSALETELKTTLGVLPPAIEMWTTFSAAPRRPRMRRLRPREILAQSLHRRWTNVTKVFQELEAEHREIIQQMERAREVVRFGLEAAATEASIVQDALHNALSLLEYQRRQRSDKHVAASRHVMRVAASAFLEARMTLTQRRLGVIAYLAQQGLRQALFTVGRSSVAAFTRALRRTMDALQRLGLAFLIAIGWKPAPLASRVEVVTRAFLPEEFTSDLEAKALPALYRHLFRLEPVQDPRFLVGREQELALIAEARALWEGGRPVAILIVGQRGSGKTSLLNGAVRRSLAGLEVIRGEFRDRLLTELHMREFLARMVGANDAAQLEDVLSASRRVVILEELERTFLRQVGYYGAIRSLQRVIAATCSSTLWILTLNEVAFRFLNAAVNLGASFSHRLNISAASTEDLRHAILSRHNLSGLRLQFPQPPQPRTLTDRIKAFVHGPMDPETLFFETLARESAGVYRTALELWLGHIETIEAGVLYLKPIVSPDLSPVIEDLDLDDLFTLVAILQHGSLTPEEHALVFQRSLAASRAQLDELLAREIIEPDPGRPGFRVRPEAARVVREALYRRNLL